METIKFEYAAILIGLFLVALYLYKKFSIRFFESRRQAIYFWTITLTIAIIWDHFAIWRGHWNFPKVLGIYVGLMPIEEYGFFVVCAFFGLTLYQVIKKKIK